MSLFIALTLIFLWLTITPDLIWKFFESYLMGIIVVEPDIRVFLLFHIKWLIFFSVSIIWCIAEIIYFLMLSKSCFGLAIWSNSDKRRRGRFCRSLRNALKKLVNGAFFHPQSFLIIIILKNTIKSK